MTQGKKKRPLLFFHCFCEKALLQKYRSSILMSRTSTRKKKVSLKCNTKKITNYVQVTRALIYIFLFFQIVCTSQKDCLI